MASIAIIGSTGFTGSHILATLLASPDITSILAFSRTPLSVTNPKLTLHPDTNSANWPSQITSLSPAPSVLFSSLAFPLRYAGTLEAQRAIEYDYHLALARTAKSAGVKVFVVISSAGASPDSKSAFMRMKGEFEVAVEGLGFEHVVFLRPFFITGRREKKRGWDGAVQSCVKVMSVISGGLLTGFWTSRVEDLAQAAVNAGLAALKGEAPSGRKVWILEGREIKSVGK
jgi:uncharacterized protein YbjT (DUF2867 family)